jgi:ATP-dependent DNA helicase RecQ
MISVIFDEAHHDCISAWGTFRPEYKEVGRLRYILPKNIPIMITSATLPPLVFNNVKEILQLRFDKLASPWHLLKFRNLRSVQLTPEWH